MRSSLIFLIAFLGLCLAGLILWAVFQGDFGAAGRFLTQTPWGIVTLFDLYLGFFLSSIIIFAFEADKRKALIWIIPIYVLGNVVTALWLIKRGLVLLPRRGGSGA